jgi:hypothetical protein
VVVVSPKALEGKTDGGKDQPVLAVIHTNAQLGLILASLFQCKSEAIANEIKTSIKKGLAMKKKKSEETKGLKKQKSKKAGGKGGKDDAGGDGVSPFEATTETNTNVPPTLAPYHIPRSKLVGQRVLGNGQFGLVWLAKQRGSYRVELFSC